MKKLSIFLVIFVIFFSGCHLAGNRTLVIGIDPSFYPADLAGQSSKVYGFTSDLFQEIFRSENLSVRSEESGSESLFSGLKRGIFQGVVSSSSPVACEIDDYQCSDPYLLTGPVIITPLSSSARSLNDLSGKLVGAVIDSEALLIVQTDPSIFLRTFNGVGELAEAVAHGVVDAVVMDRLPAETYCNNSYKEILKIASPPLNEEGLRLTVLQGKEERLLSAFQAGLKKAERSGSYAKLLEKWNVP